MKIRIFQKMDNSIFRVVICTQDWSQGDLDLMEQFGEPEVNVGGDVQYTFGGETKTKTFGDDFVRLLHGFPYCRGFDMRDYDDGQEATAIGLAWKNEVLGRIGEAVHDMRQKQAPLTTEEVTEV